jgi:hypothetical protein
MEENIGMRGVVHYIVREEDGNVKIDFEKRNLVTNLGKALAADLLIGTGTAASNIAIGTGNTQIYATSTQLNNEYKRDTATTSKDTTTVSGDTSKLVYQFSFTESKAIVESAVLNASVTGTMVCAQTFSAINVASGDSLEMTWKLAFS